MSLLDIISFGSLCWLIIILRNAYVNFCVLLPSLYGTKYLYLVSRFVTTYIESKVVLVIGSLEGGNLIMKSNAIDSYALYDTGGDCKSP